jgi:predicted XRE-type DNA-binding protein
MGTGAGAPLGAAVIGASQLAKLAAKMASKTKVPEIAKDLNTTEAITGYIIDPAKLSRNQLITKIENNKEIKTKTNNYLDEQGYGDTIPVYRIISVQDKTVGLPGRKKVIKKAEIGKENLISGSLTPEANLKTIKFFQDKGATQQQIVRYDVPRDKIKLTMGSIKDDITQNVNKKLKQKGFGQEKISGVETITNPSKSAKNLIDMQEEIIADVSGLKQTVLGSPRDLVPIDVNRILSGEIKTLKDFKNNLPSSFSYASQEDWNKLYNKKISLDEFRKIENAKTKEAFDKIIDFYGIKINKLIGKAKGGTVLKDYHKNYNTQRLI